MKVIKNGTGENWTLQVKCEHTPDKYGLEYDKGKERCGSILEIDKSDVYYREFYKYPDIEGKDYVIKCPVCGSCIQLDEEKIPEYIKSQAKDYTKEILDL